jgi:hypothetical protein
MPPHRPKTLWLCIQAALGISMIIYGQALGALLVMDCRSFYPPYAFPRCAQPLIVISIGAVICVSVAAQIIKPLARRWSKRD